jgi:hypothetical protein
MHGRMQLKFPTAYLDRDVGHNNYELVVHCIIINTHE